LLIRGCGITVGSGIFRGRIRIRRHGRLCWRWVFLYAHGRRILGDRSGLARVVDFVSGAPEFAAGVTDDAFTGVSVVFRWLMHALPHVQKVAKRDSA